MPVTSTLLDQAHNTIERKLFAMQGVHHPGGSQQAFLTGLAHLYNLMATFAVRGPRQMESTPAIMPRRLPTAAEPLMHMPLCPDKALSVSASTVRLGGDRLDGYWSLGQFV